MTKHILTLIGMRGDIFISFFAQILSGLIFIKNFQTFLKIKIDINRVDLVIEIYEKYPWVALKMSLFLAIIAHANEG